jgi:hypothetical protein
MPNTWNVGQTGKKAATYDVDVEVKRTVTVRVGADSRTDADQQAKETALTADDAAFTSAGPWIAEVVETRETGW